MGHVARYGDSTMFYVGDHWPLTFNQDISRAGWALHSVDRPMGWMFAGASAFDQDIGNWAVDSVGKNRRTTGAIKATQFGARPSTRTVGRSASAQRRAGVFDAFDRTSARTLRRPSMNTRCSRRLGLRPGHRLVRGRHG